MGDLELTEADHAEPSTYIHRRGSGRALHNVRDIDEHYNRTLLQNSNKIQNYDGRYEVGMETTVLSNPSYDSFYEISSERFA